MASINNLENMPQLVLEKITSLLQHQQLLALEQASTKLKRAVDAHFSTTDHLIIGPLHKLDQWIDLDDMNDNDKDKKYVEGLLKIFSRCGIRLRTIQLTVKNHSIHNYGIYLRHLLASADKLSNNCPNVEHIIASPYMDIASISHGYTFLQQKVLFKDEFADIYANNIKLNTGGTCKLRSISLSNITYEPEDGDEYEYEYSYQRILNLYPNLEQMSVESATENFYKFLPQFIQNGLKNLYIGCYDFFDYRLAQDYSHIWNELRTLRLAVSVQTYDDIADLNKLPLSKNVELEITLYAIDDCFAHLNENVCNSVINCIVLESTDCSLMNKLKNLEEFDIPTLKILQVIAEGSFPRLRKITNKRCLCEGNCFSTRTCDLQTVLPQLLTNKGNQLVFIDIYYVCYKSMHEVWKALKYCTAAKRVQFELLGIDVPLNVTHGDVEAICNLPNLREFTFWVKHREEMDSTCGLLRELMKLALKEFTNFKFVYVFHNTIYQEHVYSLYRIDF